MGMMGAETQRAASWKTKRKLRGLRLKIVAWFFIPSAVILALVALLNFIAYQEVTRELVLQRNRELVRLEAARISFELMQEFIAPFERVGRRIGALPASQWQEQLLLYEDQLPRFTAGVLAIQVSDGAVAAALPPERIGPTGIQSPLYQQVLQSHSTRPVVTDLMLTADGAGRSLGFALPILNEQGVRSAYLIGLFSIEAGGANEFFDQMARLTHERGDVLLVDGNGRVIYASDPARIGRLAPGDSWVERALGGISGVTIATSDAGVRRVVSYAAVPDTRWGLVLEEDWASVTASSQAYSRFLLALLGLGLLVPAAVLALGLRHVTGPVRRLSRAARSMAQGRFGEPVSVDTGDEIEELAESFNFMAGELQQSYEALERRVADRTRELATINAVASAVSQHLEFVQVLETALEAAMRALGTEGGAIYRLSDAGEALQLASSRGLSPALRSAVASLPVGAGASGAAVMRGDVAALGVREYPQGPLRQAIEQEGIEQVIGVPLISKDRVLGAMSLVRRRALPLRDEERRMLSAVGVQIGMAMENARLYEQAEQVAAHAERQRLARDLHDAVSQTLFSANLIAKVLPRLWPRDPDTALAKLNDLSWLTRAAQAEMRNLLLELRPEALQQADPADLMRQLAEAVRARTSADMTLDLQVGAPLPAAVQEVVFRVAQEALNNAVKHADPAHLRLTLITRTGQVDLTVADDGQGFDPHAAPKGRLGLGIMRERAESVGAQLKVASRAGAGTSVRLRWEDAG